MRHIGIVLGELRDTGATWNYKSTLLEKIHEQDGYTGVGIYSRKEEDVEIDAPLLKVPAAKIPRWESAEADHEIDIFHTAGIPLFTHIPAIRAEAPVVTTSHGSWHRYWKHDMPDRLRQISARERARVGLYRLSERFGGLSLDHVMTVSDWVREALVSKAGLRSEMVTTTYEAIDDSFFETDPTAPPSSLPTDYLFHVSYAKRRKNVSTVLEVLSRLESEGYEIPLVVAGAGWESRLADRVQHLGMEDRVHFPGFVSTDRLLQLYDHARCFVFPSYSETFGVPNVEAMARGTPVITSDRCAIPEVVGDGAITVPADDVCEMSRAIERIVDEDAYEKTWAERGRHRARRFRWDNHIEDVLSIYDRVLTTGSEHRDRER